MAAAERFAATHPALDQSQSFLGAAEFALATRLKGEESRSHWQKAGAAYEALLARAPDDPVRQRNVALVEKYVGASFEHDRNYSESLLHHQRALELDQKRFDRTPDDRLVQFDLAIDLGNVAYAQWRGKRLTEAIALYSRSLTMRERLLASDPERRALAGKGGVHPPAARVALRGKRRPGIGAEALSFCLRRV